MNWNIPIELLVQSYDLTNIPVLIDGDEERFYFELPTNYV